MSDGHAPRDRSAYTSYPRSITMPVRDRKGQTRREAGTQSPRTSEGGGRVAEPPRRARPAMGPPRVGAQRGPDKRPRGDATPGPDAPKRGPSEAQTHLEEALGTLERLERRRGLSNREKMRGGALGMLLRSIERVE